jgi:hypothetical protein
MTLTQQAVEERPLHPDSDRVQPQKSWVEEFVQRPGENSNC